MGNGSRDKFLPAEYEGNANKYLKIDAGETGPTYVSGTLTVEKDDTTVASGVNTINFEGSVSVVDEGTNKVTVTISGGTGIDHGDLDGLDDDDHSQYVPTDGSRGFTSTVSGVTPTEDEHLVTKSYVDDAIASASGVLIVEEDDVAVASGVGILNFAGELDVIDEGGGKITISHVPIVGITQGISFTMSDHAAHDYVGNSSMTYLSIRTFVYDGTSVWTPTKFMVIGSMQKTGATGYVRLYDYTNQAQLGEVSYTSTEKGIYIDTTLTNLPTGQAIVELQHRTSSNGNDVRCHYMALY